MGISMRNSALSNNQSQKATTNSVFSMRPDRDQIGNEGYWNLGGVSAGVDVNTVDAAGGAVFHSHINGCTVQRTATGGIGRGGRAAGESHRSGGITNRVIAEPLSRHVAGDVSMFAIGSNNNLPGG